VLSSVTFDSPDFNESIIIEADKLILSTGIEANENNAIISNMLKVPLNASDFMLKLI